MEILRLIRVLWRRRLLLLAGGATAIALGAFIGGAQPASSGFAQTRMLVDTPRSQLVATAPFGAETLPWRTSLLAHLMAREPVKQGIARRLGISSDELAVVDPDLSEPEISSSLPKAASDMAGVTTAPYVLAVYLQDDKLPVISIDAVAPDRAAAARLAAAATESLMADVPPPQPEPEVTRNEATSDAFRSDLSKRQALVVDQVAPVRAGTVVDGGLPVKALGAAIFAFALWTAVAALLGWLGPRLRARGGTPLQDHGAAVR